MSSTDQNKNETRICQNPNCPKKTVITSINKKKIFCCNRCKNQAAYFNLHNVYNWESDMTKARRRNIQIVRFLYKSKMVDYIQEKQLENMGYDPQASFLPFKDEDDTNIYRYEDLGLAQMSETTFKIIILS